MADEFSFTKNVADVRGATNVPTYKQSESIKPTSTPEFQSSVNELAASQNNLSAMGTQVAQAASNAQAVQLGYENGKTPHGDLGPSISEFDKNFEQSYHAEATNVLSLQGQKLLEDSQIQMSKSPRLTPDIIARTNQQVQTGLAKIADNAPVAVKERLEATFASQALDQDNKYKNRMLQEQREDQKNAGLNAADLYVKNIQELATKGDVKGAQASLVSAIQNADNLLANHYPGVTPEMVRNMKETAIQAGINGQYANQAIAEYKAGRYPEFAANYAKNKPEGMTNEQYITAGNHFQQQVNFLQGLRQQDDNLKTQQMINNIATNPGNITDTQWQAYANSVSPFQAEKTRFRLIQALKKNSSDDSEVNELINHYQDPEVHANKPEKVRNAAFNKSVNYMVEQTANTDNPINHEQAEAIVANNSGAVVPVFTNDLKNKLHSSNPAFMESAVNQIHILESMGGGHALTGLNDQDKALASMYTALKDKYAGDSVTAARETTQNILNQDPAQQQMIKQKWSNFVTKKAQTQPLDQWALSQFSLNKASFMNPTMAQVYGTDILSKYADLYQSAGGDQNLALNLTKKYVADNYGDTRVNGSIYKTLHPIEQTLGFKTHDCVPYIQQDVINQLSKKLEPIKKLYDDKKSNEYWEMVPLSGKTHGIIRTQYEPVKMIHHIRGMPSQTYEVALHGNNVGNYDVAINTASGMHNIHLIAPYLQILNYTADSKSIHANYNKDHHFGNSKIIERAKNVMNSAYNPKDFAK